MPWEKNKYYIFSKCVSIDLAIQHAKRMRCIILSYVACPALTYFFHIVSQTAWFLEKVTENKMCFDFLYNFVWNISHSKKNSARYNKCT
jgi:hypothetical protein